MSCSNGEVRFTLVLGEDLIEPGVNSPRDLMQCGGQFATQLGALAVSVERVNNSHPSNPPIDTTSTTISTSLDRRPRPAQCHRTLCTDLYRPHPLLSIQYTRINIIIHAALPFSPRPRSTPTQAPGLGHVGLVRRRHPTALCNLERLWSSFKLPISLFKGCRR